MCVFFWAEPVQEPGALLFPRAGCPAAPLRRGAPEADRPRCAASVVVVAAAVRGVDVEAVGSQACRTVADAVPRLVPHLPVHQDVVCAGSGAYPGECEGGELRGQVQVLIACFALELRSGTIAAGL